MKIAVPAEHNINEGRVAITPEFVRKYKNLGSIDVLIEQGYCRFYSDKDYEEAGAKLVSRESIFAEGDLIIRLQKSADEDIGKLRPGVLHISHLDPFNNKMTLEKMLANKVATISMEMIPRTTLAQKMDALSSQASIAGYEAVVIAAERIKKIFPMMMTPAGTIQPVKVFVIGAGVAGLQAIATAKRMGAKVDAFDTRPVVEDQVRSLGAKFVKIDLGDTGQTEQGYATELTKEQLAKQQELMAKTCINSDIVITTAKLFGRKAPTLLKKETLAKMKPGSVVVDLAASSGGNVEGVIVDEELEIDGVRVVGIGNLPANAAVSASQMYSSNIFSLIQHFWDAEQNLINLATDDEILAGCLITKDGEIVNESIKNFYKGS